jgi:type II secretory pathway pseudopilin PulG
MKAPRTAHVAQPIEFSRCDVGRQMAAAPQAVARRGTKTGAFTLVELLVVIVLMAAMTGLMVPAVRGLVGVTGKRGGMSSLTAVIEQARLSAMQNGVAAYVAFPFGASDPEVGYASVIVLREPREDESAGLKAVTRWTKMPRGVYVESDDLTRSLPDDSNIPLLAGQPAGSLTALEFDRFGKLRPAGRPVVIKVGEKSGPTPGDPFIGSAENHYELAVQPLTGRTIIIDKSTSAP